MTGASERRPGDSLMAFLETLNRLRSKRVAHSPPSAGPEGARQHRCLDSQLECRSAEWLLLVSLSLRACACAVHSAVLCSCAGWETQVPEL